MAAIGVVIAFLVIGLLTGVASAVAVGLVHRSTSFRRASSAGCAATVVIWLALIAMIFVSDLMPSTILKGAVVVLAAGGLGGALMILHWGIDASWPKVFAAWVLVVAAQALGVYILGNIAIDGAVTAKQKRTLADIRSVGTGAMAWQADQVSEVTQSGDAVGEADSEPVDRSVVKAADFEGLRHDEVQDLLYPSDTFFYQLRTPKLDGWGHPIEYRFNLNDPLGPRVFFIRSPGKDGKYETNRYDVGSFAATDYDADIVWADGKFVRWPEGTLR